MKIYQIRYWLEAVQYLFEIRLNTNKTPNSADITTLLNKKRMENVNPSHLRLILSRAYGTFFQDPRRISQNRTAVKTIMSVLHRYRTGPENGGFPGIDIFSVKRSDNNSTYVPAVRRR